MRDQLIEKLAAAFSERIEMECQVVYILVEIRKIMDTDGMPGNMFPVLRMFCNWAVHADLSNGRVKEQLLFLDRVISPLLKGGMVSDLDREKASAILSLSLAREELLALLRALNLNRRIPHVYLPEWWAEFLEQYVAVISDVPLLLENRNAAPGSLRKAVVTGCFTTNVSHPEYQSIFSLMWTVSFGDAQEIKLPPVNLVIDKNQSEHFGRRGRRIEIPERRSDSHRTNL